MRITNIHDAKFEDGSNDRGETWKSLDLSGKHLGVRIEEIPPGGTATLILGSEERALKKGDHVWFEAGKEIAHHIENRSPANFKYLVFGERNEGDIVYYPGNQVMMVKAPERKLYTYRPFTLPGGPPAKT